MAIGINQVEIKPGELEKLRVIAQIPGPLTRWEDSVIALQRAQEEAGYREEELEQKAGLLKKAYLFSLIITIVTFWGMLTKASWRTYPPFIWALLIGIFAFLKVRRWYCERGIIIRLIVGYFALAFTVGIGAALGAWLMESSGAGIFLPLIVTIITGLILKGGNMKKLGAYNQAQAMLQSARQQEQLAWDEIDKNALVLLPENRRDSASAAEAYEKLRKGYRTMQQVFG